jgi:hypothetical protein
MLDCSFPFSHGGLSENGPAARVTRARKIEALIKSDSSQQIGDYKKIAALNDQRRLTGL